MHISAFTDDDYQKLSDYQCGMCGLCQTKPRRLVVDYNRSRSWEHGKVRGLLCRRYFNGNFSKSREFLLKVSNYLLDPPADHVFK